MTHHLGLGTFIPLQTQNTGWASNGFGQTAGQYYAPNTFAPNTFGFFSPASGNAFGTHLSEINQGAVISSPTLALVPTPPSSQGFGAAIQQSFATEFSENNHEFVLSFDVPGIDMEDLDISLAGNTIYINGVRKVSSESSNVAYSEITRGNIARTVVVPFDFSIYKSVNTTLDNGVLTIRIAKENQADKRTPARKVKIG